MFDAYRYALVHGNSPTFFSDCDFGDMPTYGPEAPHFIRGEIGHIDGQVRIIETQSKELKMNEMMIALEAMVVRIVKDEMGKRNEVPDTANVIVFKDAIKHYADNNKAEFAAIVSQGTLDQPWFDDAVKAEVAASLPPTSAGALTFCNEEEFRNKVSSVLAGIPVHPGGYTFPDVRAFNRAVVEVVQNDNGIEDWFQEQFSDRMSYVSFSTSVD